MPKDVNIPHPVAGRRAQLRLSLRAAEVACEVSARTIWNIEHQPGRRVQRSTQRALAAGLQTTADALFPPDGPWSPDPDIRAWQKALLKDGSR
jgi:hypothetical protein